MGRCESVACCRVLLCYNFVTFKRIALKGFDTMLVASIENAEAHDYLSERLKKAYVFLRENDLGALSCGRHDIDGEDVFANVMEYDTVPAEAKKLEAHKLYYDVQCVASGIERVEVATTRCSSLRCRQHRLCFMRARLRCFLLRTRTSRAVSRRTRLST